MGSIEKKNVERVGAKLSNQESSDRVQIYKKTMARGDLTGKGAPNEKRRVRRGERKTKLKIKNWTNHRSKHWKRNENRADGNRADRRGAESSSVQ